VNKISRFWQELKRRNVVSRNAVLAGAAFVILELASILIEPFGLPEWTLKLVIVLLSVGFIVSVIISWIYDFNPEGGLEKTKPANKIKDEEKPASLNNWKIASYISFVVIIGLLMINLFGKGKRIKIDESLEKSIAVLSFDNLSTDSDQQHMCDGLTGEIINHLCKIESFDKVVPRVSVMKYKDSIVDIPLIADELDVNYILTGEYKKIGDSLRVMVQLIEPKSEKQIWQHDYNLSYIEIISLQSDIALQIASHVRAYITSSEKKKIREIPTTNPKAYELMQEAVYGVTNPQEYHAHSRLSKVKEAIRLDTGYAYAYAWAGIYTLYKGTVFGDEEMASVVWEAIPYLDKALALDEDELRAHFGWATIYDWVGWDYVRAEKAYLKGIDLEPHSYQNYGLYMEFFLRMGQYEKALRYIKKAAEINMEPYYYLYLAQIYLLQGNFPEAENAFNELRQLTAIERFTYLGELSIWFGEYENAIAYLDTAFQVIPRDGTLNKWQANLAFACYKEKNYERSNRIIEQFRRKVDTTSSGSPEYFLGWYYSSIGAEDSAFYWLNRAVKVRSPEMKHLRLDPAFKSLTDDDRYKDLYERTGHKAYDEYKKRKEQ
jgi:TolB-like protein/Flp pilus assembly protein TadD